MVSTSKKIISIVVVAIVAIYLIAVLLTGMPSQPGQPWQAPSLTPWIPTPPAPELIPPGIFFSSVGDCQTGCIGEGFDTGACQWPWPYEATGTFLGDCYIEGSRHCGNPEQCDCYCWDLEDDEEPPPEDGDAICDSLCTIFGYDYGYERVTVCASDEITQPDAGGTSCCCGPAVGGEEDVTPMTSTECSAWAATEGKQHSGIGEPTLDDCIDRAFINCDLLSGWTEVLDYDRECCIWRCSTD